MTTPRDRNYAWVTWISRVMAGEKSCVWASWFRTHHQGYARVPSDFNEAQWKMEHTRQLSDLVAERREAGDAVQVEAQNRFRYELPSGIALAGTPDLVATSGDGKITVYDVKTGQPRASDQVQVMIYMYCLPRCRPDYRDVRLEGCVVYKTHSVPIPATTVDERFEENLHHYLVILDAETPALRVPSEGECRFCEITAEDCSERIETGPTTQVEEL